MVAALLARVLTALRATPLTAMPTTIPRVGRVRYAVRLALSALIRGMVRARHVAAALHQFDERRRQRGGGGSGGGGGRRRLSQQVLHRLWCRHSVCENGRDGGGAQVRRRALQRHPGRLRWHLGRLRWHPGCLRWHPGRLRWHPGRLRWRGSGRAGSRCHRSRRRSVVYGTVGYDGGTRLGGRRAQEYGRVLQSGEHSAADLTADLRRILHHHCPAEQSQHGLVSAVRVGGMRRIALAALVVEALGRGCVVGCCFGESTLGRYAVLDVRVPQGDRVPRLGVRSAGHPHRGGQHGGGGARIGCWVERTCGGSRWPCARQHGGRDVCGQLWAAHLAGMSRTG